MTWPMPLLFGLSGFWCFVNHTGLTQSWQPWEIGLHQPQTGPIQSVGWCFEPSQSHRIISELKTHFSLPCIIVVTSHKTTKFFSITTNCQDTPCKDHHSNTCSAVYLYSEGTQQGSQHQLSVTTSRGPILFCGLAQEPALVTANTGKTQARFLGRKWRWMDREGKN